MLKRKRELAGNCNHNGLRKVLNQERPMCGRECGGIK